MLLHRPIPERSPRQTEPPPPLADHRHCSFKVASSTVSALHKASRVVINAVKLLPFPSMSLSSLFKNNSNNNNSSMRRLLSKSLSCKMLLGRRFWRKSMDEEEEHDPPCWKSFREFLGEKQQPLDHTLISSSSMLMSVTLGSSDGNSWGSSSDFTWEIYAIFSLCTYWWEKKGLWKKRKWQNLDTCRASSRRACGCSCHISYAESQ